MRERCRMGFDLKTAFIASFPETEANQIDALTEFRRVLRISAPLASCLDQC